MQNESPSIHVRRRGFYVLWAVLLLGLAGFWYWSETPSRAGTAKFGVDLQLWNAPSPARAALWVGRVETYRDEVFQSATWTPVEQGIASLRTPSFHLAWRRMSGDHLLKGTDDFAVVAVESGGQRRYWCYDVREDLKLGFLRVGRGYSFRMPVDWNRLPLQMVPPPPEKRRYIGR